MPSAETKKHWDRVAGLQCLLTEQPATIAHCHGGSIIDELGYEWQPALARKQNDWLVIPLSKELHQGDWGLDTMKAGPRGWEAEFYRQTILLEWVSHLLGYDVFERAGYDRKFETRRPYQAPQEP